MCDPVKGYGGDYSKEQGNMRVKKWELYSGKLRGEGLCQEAGSLEEVGYSPKKPGPCKEAGDSTNKQGLFELAGNSANKRPRL